MQPATKLSCWAGGRSFGQQAETHRETIFAVVQVRNHCKNLNVQSCVLGGAVKVSVLGAEGAGAAQLCFAGISLPCLIFTVVSLQLLKLNCRSTQTGCFFWSIQVPQTWGTHCKVHTKGFQHAFSRKQFYFSRNVLHSVVVFILLKSELNFEPSWEDEVCIFHSEITFRFTFCFQMHIM